MCKTMWMTLVIGAAVLAGGCVENQPAGPAAQGGASARHAECLVCKYENDLACVDVAVDDKTPRATIDGKEYFFCSEDCKRACVKEPRKYLSAK